MTAADILIYEDVLLAEDVPIRPQRLGVSHGTIRRDRVAGPLHDHRVATRVRGILRDVDDREEMYAVAHWDPELVLREVLADEDRGRHVGLRTAPLRSASNLVQA